MAPNLDNSIAIVYFNPSTVATLLNEFETSVQLGKFFARLSSDTAPVLLATTEIDQEYLAAFDIGLQMA